MEFSIQNRALKWLGYSLFFLVLFYVFLVWTFPVDRFEVTLERFLSGALGREVKIGSLGMSITGAVVLTAVEIAVDTNEDSRDRARTQARSFEDEEDEEDKEQEQESEKKAPQKLTYFIDEAVVDIGLFGLLFKRLDAELDLEAFDGTVSINYDGPLPSGQKSRPPARRRPRARPNPEEGEGEEEKAEEEEGDNDSSPLAVSVVAEEISIGRIYGLRNLLPVPLSGVLDFEMELESESGFLANSGGSVELKLSNIELSKKGYEADLMDMKMKVPPLSIASLISEITFKEGKGEMSKFEVKSKHFDASVQGTITLDDPLSRSRMDLYVMFRLLPAYINQSESLQTIMSSVDMMSSKMKRAHRDDDYYGFSYQGPLGSGRFLPQKEYRRSGSQGNTSRSSRRPRTRSRARSSVRPPSRAPSAFTGGGASPEPIVSPSESDDMLGPRKMPRSSPSRPMMTDSDDEFRSMRMGRGRRVEFDRGDEQDPQPMEAEMEVESAPVAEEPNPEEGAGEELNPPDEAPSEEVIPEDNNEE